MKRYVTGCIHFLLLHGRMIRFLVFISVLVCSINAYAVTNNLPDCSQTTVQAAITSASSGDTITCPSGNWSWSDVNITKNITLQGAGIGNTNISITANAGLESPASYTGAFRITGFTFIATDNFGSFDGAMLYIRNGHDFRVDHNEFQIYSTSSDGNGGNGVHVKYDANGLFDHNRFVKGGGSGCMHTSIQASNSGTTSTSGDAQEYSWLNFDSNTALGSSTHTLFIEDNYFYNPQDCDSHPAHAFYGRHGSILVFRHNEIHQMNADNHGFRAEHSGYAFEISNNQWIQDVSGVSMYAMMVLRGGTGVIYGNTSSGPGAVSYGVYLWTERATSPGSSSVTSNVPGYGNVAANTACNSTEGYPCAEQVGRGQNNSSDPLYIWGNTNLPALHNASGESWIQSGRDYFLNQGAKPGYTAYPYPHPLQGGGGPPPPPPDLIPSPPSIIGVN